MPDLLVLSQLPKAIDEKVVAQAADVEVADVPQELVDIPLGRARVAGGRVRPRRQDAARSAFQGLVGHRLGASRLGGARQLSEVASRGTMRQPLGRRLGADDGGI